MEVSLARTVFTYYVIMSPSAMSLSILVLLLIDIAAGLIEIGDFEECVKSQRIIGGFCTSIVDRPFQVLLLIDNQPKCGASLISNRWILTAGHCTRVVGPEYITIQVGSSKVNGTSSQHYGIEAIIVHENFNVTEFTVEHDIALLRTSTPVEFKIGVQPITLSSESPKVGSETIVSGFGVTEDSLIADTSKYLMSVEGEVVEKNECKSLLRKQEPLWVIADTSFCAGILHGGKDSCRGDSGGPITIGNVLVGIVSWGLKCAEKMPAFYTDVSCYQDWILKNINEYTPSHGTQIAFDSR